MTEETHPPALNGLELQGDDARKGTVVASTVRGRPTDAAPFLQCDYTVEWEDGKITGGLSSEAVLAMSLNSWTSQTWADNYYESQLESNARKGGSSGLDYLTVLGPPPSSAPGSNKRKSLAATPPLLSYAQAQDKSRIGSVFQPSPATAPPPGGASVRIRLSETPQQGRGSAAKAASTGKKESKRMRQKAKRRAKSESEAEDSAGEKSDDVGHAEEELLETGDTEPEVPEFFRRQYPREMCVTEGDLLLADYKDNEDEDAEFEPQCIVDDATVNRQKYVLVKWKGYELDTTDWSTVSDVKHLDVYKEWMKQKKAKKQQGK